MPHLWQTHLGAIAPFDPAYHMNARVEVASFISEAPDTVLDIGCGGGATGKLVKEKFPGTRVIGVEVNEEAASHACTHLDRVVRKAIDDVDPQADLCGERIDLVLLLDVLEHLYDPWGALTRIRGWLSPGARVVASVPNVRNLATLCDIAGGRFDYEPNGVLDITHVRFFTRATLAELFAQTGFDVLRVEPLTQPAVIDRIVVDRKPGRIDTRHMSIRYRSFADLEELYALQFVVDARVPGDAPRLAR